MPYPLHHPATCGLTSQITLTTCLLYAPLTPSSEAQGEILVDLAEYENDDEIDDGRRDPAIVDACVLKNPVELRCSETATTTR